MRKFSIDGMRKLTRMLICAFIVELIIAISSGPLNDIQLHIMNDIEFLLIFFRQASLYFIRTASDKSSGIIAWANADS